MDEALIVTSVFFFNTVFLCSLIYAFYRYKSQKLETILKLAESGGQVSPEMFNMLGGQGGPTGDLRKGLIWLAIGIPLTIGLLIEADIGPAAMVGGVPTLIGIAYLIVMKYGYKNADSL